MKDIIIERNRLRQASSQLRTAKFDPSFTNNFEKVEKEQTKLYKKFRFYDNFLKVRDKVKNEIKSNNVGEAKQL